MRVAIYFTPERSDPLTATAAAWLGRNAFGGEAGRLPAAAGVTPAGLSFHTASARRYGFHATLKAPFRLIQGQTVGSLERALAVFAQSAAPIAVPRLAVQQIDGFFALVPDEPLAELNRFADDVVIALEQFRAPLTDAENARRGPENLTPVEFRNLLQWVAGAASQRHVEPEGFEDVGIATNRASPIEAVFGPLESEPGAPFEVHSHYPLTAGRRRKSA